MRNKRKSNYKSIVKKKLEFNDTESVIPFKRRVKLEKLRKVGPNSEGSKKIIKEITPINKPIFSNYKEVPEIKKPISIIITAYDAVNYIEECLDSVENQTYFKNNDDFEILIGVDGCNETLNKILKIRHKYRNLRVFMMNENVGTFITSNTMIDIMKYDHYIRFDSDDIMLPHMVNEIMYYSDENDVIMFSYYNFNEKGYYKLKTTGNPYAAGVIYFSRNVFNIYGGYQPWKCTAEGDILSRIGNDLNIYKIDDGLFNRRVHKKSLTQSKATGMWSDLRKGYHKMIDENVKNKVKLINRVITKYYEL